MFDQADKLRQLVRETVKSSPALGPGVPLVVLSGGRAGVGATTISRELATEVAQLGQRVVLVDADPLRPQLAKQLGVIPRGGLADVLNGNRAATEVLEAVGERMHLLPGCSADTPPEMTGRSVKRLLAELRALHSVADVAVVDAGHGMTPWVERLWTAAFQVLLVTSTDSAAVMSSYGAVKLAPWGDIDGKVRLVVNRCDDGTTASRLGERFASTCQQFLAMKVQPETVAIGHQKEHGASLHYHQGLRLLAADILRSTLVLAARTRNPGAQKPSAESQMSGLLCEWPARDDTAN